MPPVEDLATVAEYLQVAGAKITDNRREFLIEGPLAPGQALAVWLLAGHDDDGQLDRMPVRVEPDGSLDDALTSLCPAGFDPEGAIPDGRLDPDRWWREQQDLQTGRRVDRAPAAKPVEPAGELVCCGEGGAWTPTAGDPVTPSCTLCPRSKTYWRSARETETGAPYEPVAPLGER